MKRALELNPNLALAHDQYAWLLTILGQFDEAIAQEKKAVQLDPLSPMMNHDLGQWFQLARRYDEAIAEYQKTLVLDANFAASHHWLGLSLLWKGETAAAISEFQKAKSLDDLPLFDSSLGYAYAVSGNRAKAEHIIEELDDLAKRRFVSPGLQVYLNLGLGNMDKAFDWLEKCYQEQDGACWTLKVDPLYDTIRNEPRFQALLKKVGLDK
jgi:tetratricopeptide (TPR) repeat protein